MAQRNIGSVSAASALLAEATQLLERIRSDTLEKHSSRHDVLHALGDSASKLHEVGRLLGVLESTDERNIKHLGPALSRLETAEQRLIQFLRRLDPLGDGLGSSLGSNWNLAAWEGIVKELAVAGFELERRSLLLQQFTVDTSSGGLAKLMGNVKIGSDTAITGGADQPVATASGTKGSVDPSKAIPVFKITFKGNTLSQREMSDYPSNYVLVQTQTPLGSLSSQGCLQELSDIGLTLLQYVSGNTYLFRRKDLELEQIRQLPYVIFACVYEDELKVAQNLKDVQVQPHRFYEVDVTFHEDVDTQSTQLRGLFTNTANISPGSLDFDQHKVRLRVQGSYVKNMASLDQVQTIERVPEVMPRSSLARRILRAGIPLENQNYVYEGKDQIVAVADTGFDRGNIRYTHPAFTTAGSQGQFKNRVLALYPMSEVSSLSDFDGHGTHVCALVLGDGFMRNPDGTRTEMKGTAPKARLVVQCLGHDLNGIPSDLTNLFRLPYHNIGARIHTNSWGACWRGLQEAYNSSAREIDRFVWDYPELLICWAAGNDGETNSNPDGIQIGAEAAAKNCITIGASKSDVHREHQILPDSSRGPTREGRIKPDVVAPGDSILSATSGHRMHPHYGRVPSSYDARWCYETGTSMSTPLVAGCAAVLREALAANGTDDPSAALIKALLINGAIPLGDVIPNNQSGYGRVDLVNSITTACRIGTAGFQQGGLNLTMLPEETIIIHIPNDQGGSKTLKVTLTWSDYPGEQLQNRLSLVVRASNGNGHTARQSPHQSRNNVQQIIWHHIQPGGAVITISALTIIQPATNPCQPYACAWQLL